MRITRTEHQRGVPKVQGPIRPGDKPKGFVEAEEQRRGQLPKSSVKPPKDQFNFGSEE